MADAKSVKVINQVHQNAILVEQITKERQHAVLTTNCNPNPRQKYFDGAEKPNSETAHETVDRVFLDQAKIAYASPQARYGVFPTSSNQEYGWDHTPIMDKSKASYNYELYKPKYCTAITKNGYIKR